jgi:hypothetical protein
MKSGRLETAFVLLLLCASAAASQTHQHGARPKHRSLVPPRPTFVTSWRGYDTGSQAVARWPYAARVADFDGDGHPDVAVAHWWAFPKLAILRNHGDGSLEAPVFYSYAKGALDLVVADFNGDGKPDIVVSNTGANNEGNTVSLFRNLGNGTFAPHVQFVVGTGSFVGPVGLAAADFNGDGRTDLAVALYGYNGRGTEIALLSNNGAGGFFAAQHFPVGVAPYKLAAGDLDGDGRPDLVVARDYENVTVLHNTGSGFAPPVTYPALGFFNFDFFATVELCDVDRDGDLDILYSASLTSVNQSTALALLRNHGDGTFGPAEALFTTLDAGGAVDIAAGDIDGDGWPDLLGATGAHWNLWRGDGQGGFLSPELMGATETPIAIELADMDGDGHVDPVVVGRESLEVAVYHNSGDGDFATPQPVQAVPSFALPADSRGMDVGDVDGDGRLDVAIAYQAFSIGTSGVAILFGTGDGGFGPPIAYPTPKDAIYAKLADLDGDGRPDLLWADDAPTYDVKTRMNLGNGQFGPVLNWPMNTCGNGEVAAIDVDNDGDLDLVLCEYGGCPNVPLSGTRVFIRKNNGDGTFALPYIHTVSGFPERVRGADVNNDGLIDLLFTGNSWIDVCLGIGNGFFAAPMPAACDWGPKGLCVGDWNGDGKIDIATTNYGDVGSGGETVSIMLGHGDGTFAPPTTTPASYSHTFGNSRDIVAGDVDHDGRLDLMAGAWGSLDVSYYHNEGQGSFAPQVRYGTGWPTLDLAFGDFTGDGRGDLLAHVSWGTGLSFLPGLVLLKSK